MRKRQLVAATALLFALISTATAQTQIPSPATQEIMVRTTILTFNDANVTDNYTVLYARLSKGFQGEITVEKLQTAFKAFRDGKFELWATATAPLEHTAATILPNGFLELTGDFTTPSSTSILNYNLQYMRENGDWAIASIGIDIHPKSTGQ